MVTTFHLNSVCIEDEWVDLMTSFTRCCDVFDSATMSSIQVSNSVSLALDVASLLKNGFEDDFPCLLSAKLPTTDNDVADTSFDAGSRRRSVRAALADCLWSVDKEILDALLDSSLSEYLQLYESSADCLDLDGLVPEGSNDSLDALLCTLARMVSTVFQDDWDSCTLLCSTGEERCLAQQDAMREYKLGLCLRLEEQLHASAVWEAQMQAQQVRADEQKQAQEDEDAALATALAGEHDLRGREKRHAAMTVPSHALGFRLEPSRPTGLAAAAASGALALGRGNSPAALTAPALELLSTLECACGAGCGPKSLTSGSTHTRSCLQSLYNQANEQVEAYRHRKAEKARQGAQMTRKFGRSAPGVGMAYAEEVRSLSSKQAAAKAIADLVMFWLHNPTTGAAMVMRTHAGPVAAQHAPRLTSHNVASSASSAHARERGEFPCLAAGAVVSIDLHGVSAAGAQVLVWETLLTAAQQGQTRIRFITGHGKHSGSGRSVLRENVGGYLRQLQLEGKELISSVPTMERGRTRLQPMAVVQVQAAEGGAAFDVVLGRG